MPPAGSGGGGASAASDTAQLGLASFNTFCAGIFALGLLLRLDNTVPLSWLAIFLPFLLGHATTAVVHTIKLRAARDRATEQNPGPSMQLVRVRDANESLYKLLQSCGVVASCGLLIFAISMGPPDEGAGSGSTPKLVGFSFSLVCLPVWLAWAAETWVWLRYRSYRNRALMNGLTPNHAAIKIRGHDEIFFYNLMVTLVARMLDGAYTCTWMTLFTVVWVQLLLIALLYSICFLICMIGLALSHTQRYQPSLALYRQVFLKSLLLVSFGSFTVVLYSMFWHNLAKRMDGDETITHSDILIPLIVKVGPELLSSLILYTTGGHTTIHDSIRSTTEEGERVQWEREKEEYAAIAPKKLVQQSATFFKAIEEKGEVVSSSTATVAVGAAVVAAGGGGAPPGGVWDEAELTAEADLKGGTDGAVSGEEPDDRAVHLSPPTVAAVSGAGVGGDEAEEQSLPAPAVEREPPPPPNPPKPSSNGSDGWGTGSQVSSEDGRECDICLSAPREVALLPCGHGGMCRACAYASVELPGHCCPLCRQRVLMVAELRPEDASTPRGGEKARRPDTGGGDDLECGCEYGAIFDVVLSEPVADEGGTAAGDEAVPPEP